MELDVFGSLASIKEVSLGLFKTKLFFLKRVVMHVNPFSPLIW